jgi:hydrogenase nickel incorporation protein HypB
VFTSARRGQGVGLLLDRALAVGAGTPVHRPVMATPLPGHHHHGEDPDHDPDHDGADAEDDGGHDHGRGAAHSHPHVPAH